MVAPRNKATYQNTMLVDSILHLPFPDELQHQIYVGKYIIGGLLAKLPRQERHGGHKFRPMIVQLL